MYLMSYSSNAGKDICGWIIQLVAYLAYMSLQAFEPIHTKDKPHL